MGVDNAEAEKELATIINGDILTAIAYALSEMKIPLVHISTNYVFKKLGEEPWKQFNTTTLLNAYGLSKLAGEKGALESEAIKVNLRN